jgi:hypothetical protein
MHYVFVFDPHQDPFHQDGRPIAHDDARGWVANPIDVMFKSVIHRTDATVEASRRPRISGWMMRDPRWQMAFDKVLIILQIKCLPGIDKLTSTLAGNPSHLRCPDPDWSRHSRQRLRRPEMRHLGVPFPADRIGGLVLQPNSHCWSHSPTPVSTPPAIRKMGSADAHACAGLDASHRHGPNHLFRLEY